METMRFRIVVVIAIAFACGQISAEPIPKVPGWELFWHDEFDGDSLNQTYWEAPNRQDSQNNEKQYYLPEQVSVSNGNLQLTATSEPLANKRFRSGIVKSQESFGPGRFEARIRLPTTQGMWPAFWLNTTRPPWPQGGEIDIMENKGSQPKITSSAFHWQKDPGPCCANWHYVSHNYTAANGDEPVDFTTGFHTYSAEWDRSADSGVNEIRYYVDGNLHFTVSQTTEMSDTNFTTAKHIILNLAVGGDFGGNPNETTVFPQTMLVDYVRVWRRPTESANENVLSKVDSVDNKSWPSGASRSGIELPAAVSGN